MNTLSLKDPLALPPWYQRFNQWPVANQKWIKLKLPADERSRLVDCQRDWAATMRQTSGQNPVNEAKSRWLAVRRQYEKTRNPALLDELGAIGERGSLLCKALREKLHAIRDTARKIPVERNCAPIYVHTYELALHQVLERIRDTERAEREAHLIIEDREWAPSELLCALANLASHFKTQAASFSDFQGDILACPADALSPLWPQIVNNSEKGKTHK